MTVDVRPEFRPEHRLVLQAVSRQLGPLIGSDSLRITVAPHEVFDRNPTFRATADAQTITFNPARYGRLNTGGVRSIGAHELIHVWQARHVGTDLLALTQDEAASADIFHGRWYEGEPYIVGHIYSTEGHYAVARRDWASFMDRIEDVLHGEGCELPPWARPSITDIVGEGLVSGIQPDEYYGFFITAPPRLRAAVAAAFRDIPQEIPRALAISFYESRWQEDAECLNCLGVSEHSVGAFQINLNVHEDWVRRRGLDPMRYEDAAQIARQLYDWRVARKQDGWSDWSAARAHGIVDTNPRTPLP